MRLDQTDSLISIKLVRGGSTVTFRFFCIVKSGEDPKPNAKS